MLVHFAYFFTFSFFSETPMNGCFASVILMAANGCFTNKIFGCSNVQKDRCKVQKYASLKENEVCSLELADMYLQVMKSLCLILPNY